MSHTESGVRHRRLLRAIALSVPILLGAILAFHLRRLGHTEGDDFALYLRQARSIFDGDPAAVVSDNRFSVMNSDPGFSPVAYPWGWPLLLSPFVHAWSFDYDRLKLVEIAAFAVWLVLFHGIVRRRLGRSVAAGLVVAIATAPAYLAHSDELLSEFPHLAAVAAVLWWHDRLRTRSSLILCSDRDLIVMGLLIVAAFNIRRESVVLVPMIALVQLIDLRQMSTASNTAPLEAARSFSRAIVLPVASFVVGVACFQLVLPTDLFPSNGNGAGSIIDRWSESPAIVGGQIGIGDHAYVGAVLASLSILGAVAGVRQRPTLDAPLVITTGLTMIVIGTHVRQIDRYWLQVTPWVMFFIASFLVAASRVALDRITSSDASTVSKRATILAVTPLVALATIHLVAVRSDIREVRRSNAQGIVQDGPAHPLSSDMMSAVVDVTPPDSIVTYYRARTMTLLTDRRSIQTRDIERIRSDSDFWVQRRDWSFWQPDLDESAVRGLGFVDVWSNDRYVIWCTRCSG